MVYIFILAYNIHSYSYSLSLFCFTLSPSLYLFYYSGSEAAATIETKQPGVLEKATENLVKTGRPKRVFGANRAASFDF